MRPVRVPDESQGPRLKNSKTLPELVFLEGNPLPVHSQHPGNDPFGGTCDFWGAACGSNEKAKGETKGVEFPGAMEYLKKVLQYTPSLYLVQHTDPCSRVRRYRFSKLGHIQVVASPFNKGLELFLLATSIGSAGLTVALPGFPTHWLPEIGWMWLLALCVVALGVSFSAILWTLYRGRVF